MSETYQRIMRLPEVMQRTGIRRSSLYKGMKEGTFPRQIKMGLRSSGWIESEIEDWIKQRMERRGT